MSEAELERAGFKRLPRNLSDAIKEFGSSELMRETLGDHICDYLIEQKCAEWDEYAATVTEWERRHYYAGY